MLLIGDVGGTKTDLAIVSPESGPRVPIVQAQFHSSAYSGLEAMAREFLAQAGRPVRQACFDVAGPVVEGRAHLTNLPWEVDAATLRRHLNLDAVWLINDLMAIAHAVPLLAPDDLCTLNIGVPVVGGAIAVIAPGTGLGEAFLVWDGSRYRAFPSEGGHANSAPCTDTEIDLLCYLRQGFGHVSVERVCSGMGIPNLYAFFRDRGYASELPELAAKFAAAEDKTPLIVEAALDPASLCKLSKATLDTFVAILGSEAGNLALKVLATGGVYLSGGIAPRILSALGGGRFMRAFRQKGRLTGMVARIPVHVILKQVALIGAASFGLGLISSGEESVSL